MAGFKGPPRDARQRLFGTFDYTSCMDTRNSCASLLSGVFVVSLCCSQLAYGDAVPCDLLTQNQVSAVVGVSVGAGSPIANTGCSWQTTSAPRVMVTVSMQSEKMFAAAKSSSAMPKETKMPISGIGDDAVFSAVQNFASLWVRKGAKHLLVRIYGLPVSEAETKLKALAANALSKL
jgi:hypothetical protein